MATMDDNISEVSVSVVSDGGSVLNRVRMLEAASPRKEVHPFNRPTFSASKSSATDSRNDDESDRDDHLRRGGSRSRIHERTFGKKNVRQTIAPLADQREPSSSPTKSSPTKSSLTKMIPVVRIPQREQPEIKRSNNGSSPGKVFGSDDSIGAISNSETTQDETVTIFSSREPVPVRTHQTKNESKLARLHNIRARSPSLFGNNRELKRNLDAASVVMSEEKASSIGSSTSSRSSLSNDELENIAHRALAISKMKGTTRTSRMENSPLHQMMKEKRARKPEPEVISKSPLLTSKGSSSLPNRDPKNGQDRTPAATLPSKPADSSRRIANSLSRAGKFNALARTSPVTVNTTPSPDVKKMATHPVFGHKKESRFKDTDDASTTSSLSRGKAPRSALLAAAIKSKKVPRAFEAKPMRNLPYRPTYRDVRSLSPAPYAAPQPPQTQVPDYTLKKDVTQKSDASENHPEMSTHGVDRSKAPNSHTNTNRQQEAIDSNQDHGSPSQQKRANHAISLEKRSASPLPRVTRSGVQKEDRGSIETKNWSEETVRRPNSRDQPPPSRVPSPSTRSPSPKPYRRSEAGRVQDQQIEALDTPTKPSPQKKQSHRRTASGSSRQTSSRQTSSRQTSSRQTSSRHSEQLERWNADHRPVHDDGDRQIRSVEKQKKQSQSPSARGRDRARDGREPSQSGRRQRGKTPQREKRSHSSPDSREPKSVTTHISDASQPEALRWLQKNYGDEVKDILETEKLGSRKHKSQRQQKKNPAADLDEEDIFSGIDEHSAAVQTKSSKRISKPLQATSGSSNRRSEHAKSKTNDQPPPPPPPPLAPVPDPPTSYYQKNPYDRSGMVVVNSEGGQSIVSDLSSSMIAGKKQQKKKKSKTAAVVETIAEEDEESARSRGASPKSDFDADDGESYDDSFGDTPNPSGEELCNEQSNPASVFLNLGSALVDSFKQAISEVDQKSLMNAVCPPGVAASLKTKAKELCSIDPDEEKPEGGSGSSRDKKTGKMLNEKERRVWEEWDKREAKQQESDSSVSDIATRKRRHEIERNRAQLRLKNHVRRATGEPESEEPDTASSVLGPQPLATGNRNFPASCDDASECDNATRSTTTKSTLSYPTTLSVEKTRILSVFSSALRSEGVKVLKLNRHQKWQVRYLVVSRESSQKGASKTQCPKALLWLKNPNLTGRKHSSEEIKKHGGLPFSGLSDIKTAKLSNPTRIPKKEQKSFPSFHPVSVQYLLDGSVKKVLLCLQSQAEVEAFRAAITIIKDVVDREDQNAEL